jgi:DNA-binding NtrC family response regulator
METSTILLVDDDVALLDGLRRSLRSERWRILTAENAVKAMDVLDQEAVSVVVSDERMPGIPGAEFLAQLRLLHPGVVRILLTGNAEVSTLERAINEGHIFRYLAKPCKIHDLQTALFQALTHRRLLDRASRALVALRRQNAVLNEIHRRQPELLLAVVADIKVVPPTPLDTGHAPEAVDQLAAALDCEVDHITGLLPVLPG